MLQRRWVFDDSDSCHRKTKCDVCSSQRADFSNDEPCLLTYVLPHVYDDTVYATAPLMPRRSGRLRCVFAQLLPGAAPL